MTIVELLDAAKARQGFRSDGQLSRALGLTDTVASQYRRGRGVPSPEIALRLAHLAGVDPNAAVLAVLQLQTRDDHLRRLYSELARKISAAVLLAVAFLGCLSSDANAAGTDQHARCRIYTLCDFERFQRLRRRLLGWARRAAAAFLADAGQSGMLPPPLARTQRAAPFADAAAVYHRLATVHWHYWRPSVLR